MELIANKTEMRVEQMQYCYDPKEDIHKSREQLIKFWSNRTSDEREQILESLKSMEDTSSDVISAIYKAASNQSSEGFIDFLCFSQLENIGDLVDIAAKDFYGILKERYRQSMVDELLKEEEEGKEKKKKDKKKKKKHSDSKPDDSKLKEEEEVKVKEFDDIMIKDEELDIIREEEDLIGGMMNKNAQSYEDELLKKELESSGDFVNEKTCLLTGKITNKYDDDISMLNKAKSSAEKEKKKKKKKKKKNKNSAPTTLESIRIEFEEGKSQDIQLTTSVGVSSAKKYGCKLE